VLAALSTSPETLIAARALQGVAGATLLPSIMALVFGMFADERQRTAALGDVVSCFAAGAALGPLPGGVLLEFFDWGSVFLLNVPVMALLLVLGPRLLPEFRNQDAGHIDVTSAALSIVGILAVVYGIKELAHDGLAALPAMSILAGLSVGAAFVRRQGRLAEPLIDIELFRRRAFSAALGANVAGVLVMYGVFFFTSQYLQLVLGLSPLEAGLWGLPGIAAIMFSSAILVPRLAAQVRPGHLVGAGMTISALGFALLIALDADAGMTVLVPALMIASFGLAPAATLGTNLVVGAAPPERAGAASGLAETGNELGGALGIALLGSLGTALYRGRMEDAVPSEIAPSAAAAARDSLGGAVSVADRLSPSVIDAAHAAFAHGLHVAAATGAVLMAGIAVVAGVLLRHVPSAAGAPEPAGDLGVDATVEAVPAPAG
jgi:DHA2 family multidrug resistance protein-like MFS transporter